jgi:rubrerythrin
LSSKGGSRLSEQTTCSAIISFAEKLEDNSSKFYEELAEKSAENKEIFLAFAKEGRKNKVLVTRTYQETITDALEACFIQINLSSYLAETTLKEDMNYLDALKMAIELEEKASKFYFDAAEQSKSLLATIPRAFRKVAERRKNRKPKLKSLVESLM